MGFEAAIDDLTSILDWLPGDDHSNEMKSARQLLGWAIDNLQRAPTDYTVALARLLAAYQVKQETRFTVQEGLSVSFREATAMKLNAILPVAQVFVASGQGTTTIWIDDGPDRLDIPAQAIVDNAANYTVQYAQMIAWVSAKRIEIEQSDDPLAVSLD